MDFTNIPPEMWLNQGIFFCLFIYLFVNSRKEAKEREDKLMQQIKEQNQAQSRIVESLERLENKINSIEGVR